MLVLTFGVDELADVEAEDLELTIEEMEVEIEDMEDDISKIRKVKRQKFAFSVLKPNIGGT